MSTEYKEMFDKVVNGKELTEREVDFIVGEGEYLDAILKTEEHDDDSGRWESYHTFYFNLKENPEIWYSLHYSRGLTEMQEGNTDAQVAGKHKRVKRMIEVEDFIDIK